MKNNFGWQVYDDEQQQQAATATAAAGSSPILPACTDTPPQPPARVHIVYTHTYHYGWKCRDPSCRISSSNHPYISVQIYAYLKSTLPKTMPTTTTSNHSLSIRNFVRCLHSGSDGRCSDGRVVGACHMRPKVLRRVPLGVDGRKPTPPSGGAC